MNEVTDVSTICVVGIFRDKISCLSSVEYKEHLFVRSVKLKDARIVFFKVVFKVVDWRTRYNFVSYCFYDACF